MSLGLFHTAGPYGRTRNDSYMFLGLNHRLLWEFPTNSGSTGHAIKCTACPRSARGIMVERAWLPLSLGPCNCRHLAKHLAEPLNPHNSPGGWAASALFQVVVRPPNAVMSTWGSFPAVEAWLCEASDAAVHFTQKNPLLRDSGSLPCICFT